MKKKELDMARIAQALGAERRGKVRAKGGHFGATALLAEVQARFRAPERGGRATDPDWTERRLVALAPATLRRLGDVAAKVRKRGGVQIEPMQLAALLLEKATKQLSAALADELLDRKAG
jgi:hypothetical protein